MDKLNLNQSLRIYIPGLFLSLLLFYTVKDLYGSSDIKVIFIPSIFIGLLLNFITLWFHKKLFGFLLSRKTFSDGDYYQTWESNFLLKLEIFKKDKTFSFDDVPNKGIGMLNFIGFIFYSKRYNNPELSFFRFPKSLAILFFNIAFSCILGLIIICFLDTFSTFSSKISSPFQLIFILTTCLLFFLGSIKFFKDSLRRELIYWNSINENEVEELVRILYLWKIKFR